MGTKDVRRAADPAEARHFQAAILADLQAADELFEAGRIETGIRRYGLEQEMFLVDGEGRPAWVAPDVLTHLPEGEFTSELAVFNLEANLPPRPLGPRLLETLEADLTSAVARADAAARRVGARVVLAGMLPTLRGSDVDLGAIFPAERYLALNDGLVSLRGGPFRVRIRGLDVLDVEHDSVLLEAANTSVQLHLQVDLDSFGPLYNLAQLLCAPQVACAVNSPLLLGRRLWQETRIALFEGAVDTRTPALLARGAPPRVGFGQGWVRRSPLELWREDVARHPVLLVRELGDDPVATVRAGGAPPLSSLAMLTGTVWRWNRACYGVVDGVAHLRIENRVLPAGPTVADTVANAALFYGLMEGLAAEAPSIPDRIGFDQARANLEAAARYGPDATLTWLDGERLPAHVLFQRRLLPVAWAGLEALGVPTEDTARHLGVLEERMRTRRTGARWLLDGHAALEAAGRRDAEGHLVATMLARQADGAPVHTWAPAEASAGGRPRVVGEILSEDLYTLRPDDCVAQARAVMRWRRLRHLPVEDTTGAPAGVVTHHDLLRAGAPEDAVSAVMTRSPPAVHCDMPLEAASRHLLGSRTGCLLVVDGGRLVGLVTPRDVLRALAPTFGVDPDLVARGDAARAARAQGQA